MCDGAVDDYLAALKLIPDWFVTSEMIKKLFTALYADENILYFNEASDNVVFNSIAICGCLKCSFSSSGSFGFCQTFELFAG